MSTDIYIRAEDEAHAVRIAQAAGVLALLDDDGNAITSIPSSGSTLWEPSEAELTARGIPITPTVTQLLSLAPWKVFYVPMRPMTAPEDDSEPQPIPGVWYGLRVNAPDAAVSILVGQLSAETWQDGVTAVLVSRADFPTLSALQ